MFVLLVGYATLNDTPEVLPETFNSRLIALIPCPFLKWA